MLLVALVMKARGGGSGAAALPRPTVPCPKCRSLERVVPVVYGPPKQENLRLARERKIHLGGLTNVEGAADSHCLACGYTFFSVLTATPPVAKRG